MFSLVITVIAIALATALALGTVYYGGSAFRQGTDAAKAAEAINGAQQIHGADQIYEAATGRGASTLGELVANNYLSTVPNGDWAFVAGQAVRIDLSENACLEANKKLGISVVPMCSDPAYADKTVCCQVSQ